MVMVVLRLPAGRSATDAIAELEALEPGSTAGVNHAYRDDTEPRPVPAGREYANAAVGWPGTGCAPRIAIGIIDTDPGPQGLTAEVVHRSFGAAGAGTAHGAAIAALLAGPGRLTAPRIFHAGVVGPDARGAEAASVDALVRAFDWMQANEVRLVNVSLAGPYNRILDRSIQAAARRGMVIVAAAGNTGPDGPPRYPAAFDQTISVTAVDAALVPFARATAASRIDIAAPGVDVFVTVDGAGSYLSGTSIAAPFVTAVIAADAEAAGLGSVGAIRDWLGSQAWDLGAPGTDSVFGAGLVQAGAECRDGA
jgi:hypothetical protein